MKKETHVSEEKKKSVAKLIEMLDKYNTIIFSPIANISAQQFKEIKRSLKGKAEIKVVKKKLMLRALDKSKKDVFKLKEYLDQSFAVIFSNEDAFELAAMFSETKTSAKVKAGQIAPKDIIIEPGPTDLMAGPVISELTKAGIKATIEAGKIAIREESVLAKKGEKVSKEAADILAKLEIEPVKAALPHFELTDERNAELEAIRDKLVEVEAK